MKNSFKTLIESCKSINERTLTYITYGVFFVMSVIFMLIFSLWTSPYYKNWYGCDASFFTLVGRGITMGMVPYRDFFDLKGPYFFFIEALGQFIHKGRLGIFILQIPFLFISLVLIYRIGRMYISHKKTLWVTALFLFAYISMLWGGNCLEEFCLPLDLLIIWLNLGYYDKAYRLENEGHSLISYGSPFRSNINLIATLTGLCFGIITFSKITVAAPIVGIVLAIFILHMIKKDYSSLLFYAIYFVLGLLIAVIPLLIYFGYHGCILRMLYCVFIFGFKRSSDFTDHLTLELEIKLAGVIFAVLFAIFHVIKSQNNHKQISTLNNSQNSDNKDNNVTTDSTNEILVSNKTSVSKSLSMESCLMLLMMSIVTYIVLHLGDSFIYYFITGMPCMLLALILFLRLYDPFILFVNVRQCICFFIICIFMFHYSKDSINTINTFLHHKTDIFQNEYYNNSLDLGSLIPEMDKDKVFSFDIDMQWYEINNIMPCNPYMVNLQFFIALDPSIEDDLYDFFENTPPKWILISNTLEDYLPQFNEIINLRYDCLYSNEVGKLYLYH